MAFQQIQWFPGHMAVTRRLIRESLPEVDAVFELLDARIPYSSRNPEIRALLGAKPSVILLNKADLADPAVTERWVKALTGETSRCVAVNCKTGNGIREAVGAARELLRDKWAQYEKKGIHKPLRAMVVGIPNVGKSTLINRLAGTKKAKAENRPGVTKTKQWFRAGQDLELLDTPGILWPKFDEEAVGEDLALTGAIRDEILDETELAVILCGRLTKRCPELFRERYKLTEEDLRSEPYDLFCRVGQKRGLLRSGGEIDEDRCARMLLDEFRSGLIGRISLEDV